MGPGRARHRAWIAQRLVPISPRHVYRREASIPSRTARAGESDPTARDHATVPSHTTSEPELVAMSRDQAQLLVLSPTCSNLPITTQCCPRSSSKDAQRGARLRYTSNAACRDRLAVGTLRSTTDLDLIRCCAGQCDKVWAPVHIDVAGWLFG